MQLTNTAALNAYRAALLQAFDDAWTPPCTELSPRALRALHCAQRLYDTNARSTYEMGAGNCIVFPGGTVTAPRVICA